MKVITVTTTLLLCLASPLFAQSGELQLHPKNPHYFLYRHQPAILVGSGEHYGAVVDLDFDHKTYLQALAKDSLNITWLFTGAYVEKPGDFGIQKNTLAPAKGRLTMPWKRSSTPSYALGGNKFDLTQWKAANSTQL